LMACAIASASLPAGEIKADNPARVGKQGYR
jgi:hypothetical protein